jgi:polysaccharide chain length determinant protein (PEP-CTERM system associated)
MNVEQGIQPGDLLGILKRRSKLIGAIAGAVFLAAYWLAMALPNQYESYATLLVEPQSVSDSLVEAGVGESDLNTRLHLMTAQILSRSRLSRIIDDLELYSDESRRMTREEVIDLMRSKIRVMPVLPELEATLDTRNREVEINTFQIYYSSDQAGSAAQVAQRLANDFIEEHISERVGMTRKSLEFIQDERVRLAAAIQGVEQQIAAVKAQNPGRLPEDLGANQRMQERTMSDIRDAQRQLDVARSDAAFWANQTLAFGTSATRFNDDASPVRKLQLLELSLAEFRAKGFTDKHPDLIKVLAELGEVRKQIEIMGEKAKDEERPISLAQQSAEAERRRSELRVQAAEGEIERLSVQLEAIIERIVATPRVAEQLDALVREYAQLSDTEDDFANRRQEASVQADMERRQLGEQFRILESAFPSPVPSSPNRLLMLVVGLMLGIAIGGGAGILIEATDSSVHGARQLQDALSIPVLASIPAIMLESDRAARARRRLRQAVAGAAVAVFCLVGGAVTYVFVNGAPGWLSAVVEQAEEEEAAEGAALQIELERVYRG